MPQGDTPAVVAPPPLVFAAVLVLGWLLSRVLPQPALPRGIAHAAGVVLALAAGALALAALRELRRVGTPVSPYAPTASLVRTGPFAYSRNPLYLALVVVTVGFALLANALWCVVLLVPAVVVLQRGVIAREEAYLLRRFGDEYRRYCAATRQWI
jgi:protein-S-isoprenylcysteine O-methyltransferase Ste14